MMRVSSFALALALGASTQTVVAQPAATIESASTAGKVATPPHVLNDCSKAATPLESAKCAPPKPPLGRVISTTEIGGLGAPGTGKLPTATGDTPIGMAPGHVIGLGHVPKGGIATPISGRSAPPHASGPRKDCGTQQPSPGEPNCSAESRPPHLSSSDTPTPK